MCNQSGSASGVQAFAVAQTFERPFDFSERRWDGREFVAVSAGSELFFPITTSRTNGRLVFDSLVLRRALLAAILGLSVMVVASMCRYSSWPRAPVRHDLLHNRVPRKIEILNRGGEASLRRIV